MATIIAQLLVWVLRKKQRERAMSGVGFLVCSLKAA